MRSRFLSVLQVSWLLSWSGSEYGWGLIHTDASGQKLWGCNKNARYMTTDGERIYIAGAHGFDPKLGAQILSADDSRPTRFNNDVAYLAPPEGAKPEQNTITGLEYNEGHIYVAYGERDTIAVFNNQDGSIKKTWDVPSPGRMATRPDDSLAVITDGEKVVTVTEGQVTPYINEHLDQPVGIAVADNGTVYVSNQGDLHNVSIFDPKGSYQKSIGREGGRPAMGTFNPQGIYQPDGIDLDAKGRLWVDESASAPKRISVWNIKTGKNVDQFFGGSGYFAHDYIDPAQPVDLSVSHSQ